MIDKFIISKDNKYYRAFTDLININNRWLLSTHENDGKIYVTAHIVDDNFVAQIRGYSFYEKDLAIK